MAEQNELESVANFRNKLRLHRYLLCAPIGKLNVVITVTVISSFLYIFLCAILERNVLDPLSFSTRAKNYTCENGISFETENSYMALFFIFFISSSAGWLVHLCRLPALLGMLLAGIVCRNLPAGLQLFVLVSKKHSSVMRKLAFLIILVHGGLNLDGDALKRLKGACLRLATAPCVFEAVTVMVASYLFLNLKWSYGLLLGFALGAVSPAVCIPTMVSLVQQGYGTDSGIPSLVIAASSVDDIVAIGAFSFLLAVTFAQEGSLLMTVLSGPFELLVGIVFGIGLGLTSWYFPNPQTKKRRAFLRVSLLLSGCASVMCASAMFLNMAGSGPVGCLVGAFVASVGWKRRGKAGNIDEERMNAVEEEEDKDVGSAKMTSIDSELESVSLLWDVIFQPLLFSLIGLELDLSRLGINRIFMAVLTMSFGLIVRTFVAFLAVSMADLSIKERLFVAVAWLPKATVQAALGPVVHDMAIDKNLGQEQEEAGMTLLSVAVLSILVTAPLGSILMTFAGPHLLSKDCSRGKDLLTTTEKMANTEHFEMT